MTHRPEDPMHPTPAAEAIPEAAPALIPRIVPDPVPACVAKLRELHEHVVTHDRSDLGVMRALRAVAAEVRAEADALGGIDWLRYAEPMRAEADAADAAARPVLHADDGDLEKLTDRTWQAVELTNDPPSVFRYGGLLARIEHDDDDAPLVRALNIDRVRHLVSRRATWVKTVRGKTVAARPPQDVARDLLATPDPPLPVLSRIVEVPVLGPNGELATTPGYHPTSRTFYEPPAGLTVPPVPEDPTPAEVEAARTLLADELLGDFPFVGDAERAHALALLLLPFVRDLIDGPTPLHLIEKPSPGTGGTLLSDVLALPALGRPLAAMTEARDEDEWRKRITAKLLPSPSHVLIDNLRRRLDSAAVSAALTTLAWEDRVLGASEVRSIPVRCAWVATGNNPSLSDELTRRSVRIRLDARHERPQMRSGFRHPDLRAWATANRGELVAAALTLARAWLAADRPTGDHPTLGSFEAWSRVLGGVLAVAGVPGFLSNLGDFYEASEDEGAAWRELVAQWHTVHADRAVPASDLLGIAGELFDLGHGSERSRQTKLGALLKGARDRRYGDWRIECAGVISGSTRYRLVPTS
jgi:putative DNA primase/helicase